VIVGDNFGNDVQKVSVKIGTTACTVTALSGHGTVECTTPEYTGWADSTVVITVGGQDSTGLSSFEYKGKSSLATPVRVTSFHFVSCGDQAGH
jgi:hypothetical protein